MKILIVDDEPLVRIGIKSAIDWQAEGVEIIGEAGDGAEALRLIASEQPDVVLLDIKMPKMDGLEVLRRIKEQELPVKVVVLSSFDDFGFVKEAMKLGALDYFHKPDINDRELIGMLQNIREQLGTAPIPSQPPRATNHKEQLLSGLLYGTGIQHELSETRLKEGNIYVVLFKIKNYDKVLQRYSESSQSVLGNTVQNMVNEMVSAEREIEFVPLNERLSALLISNSELKSLLASLTRVNDIVQRISSTLKRFVNIDIVLGISDWVDRFEQVPTAYKQALQALSHHFYHPESSIFYYSHQKERSEVALEQAEVYVKQMKSALAEHAHEKFMDGLSRWENLIRTEECLDEAEVQKVYEGLLFMMDRNGSKAKTEAEEELTARGAFEDFEQMSSAYRTVFEQRLGGGTNASFKGYSQLIRNILEYIEHHYQDSLSLKLFADLFQVSPNYVSRLFKEEVGQGLFDYINELRINKAKELLKDYRYKIYEVAEKVGFSNQAHFAIVFNKYTGVSPKQYRNEEG
ncbi:response regulator receiver domain protein [Paenibacillus sp. oral taxon 786 str. D14]|uniref:response regulator transcription factor n=1 Tax=Paenibacillus sp. oral taxon 786 TaxID=652715 RepID=UPI0001AFD43F|nr:response regulator [Paenibacillus sp. oral taxon 786]EES71231.1 response regulator receiver domain protein [Paenibacillus sp. oral taxon 786 str. D14]